MAEPEEHTDNWALRHLRWKRMKATLIFGAVWLFACFVMWLLDATPNTGMVIAAAGFCAWYGYSMGVRDVFELWQLGDAIREAFDKNPLPPEN